MKSIGLKALKAKLGEYVRLAKSGEVVLITERDEVVAELRPANRQRTGPLSLEDHLSVLGDNGAVTLASEAPAHWRGFGARVRLVRGTSHDLLDELRGDG